ncbi:MAG: uracil-DNA glycosylase, partial [Acidimicrobiia bacterium]
MSLSIDAPKFSSFDALRERALGCTACGLAETRTQVVFGVGDPHADLVFVGEGPGEQEDLQGEPFVGRAGQLLTLLIEGIGLTRGDVYIANVVKCRPPGNRDPLPVEIETCRPYLESQLDFIDPS